MSEHRATRRRVLQFACGSTAVGLAGCLGGNDDSNADGGGMDAEPTDPAEAPRTTVDRFSEAAGTQMVRTDENDLPGPGEPVDFDRGRFRTRGLGPDGEAVQYYNFDVRPMNSTPIYTFVRENGDPVEEQLDIVDAVPGDEGYNDFWHVHQVTVPDDYEANTATSLADIESAGYDINPTGSLKNCPVVPAGSTASLRHGDATTELVDGWYSGELVSYFLFEESGMQEHAGSIPLSPIYVCFNTNPGEEGGGPQSGFMTETSSDQSHNVVATLPADDDYSPLWMVNVYDNAEFQSVSDLDSARNAELLREGASMVNCPLVSVE
jgi:hypothetical protein